VYRTALRRIRLRGVKRDALRRKLARLWMGE
jgi:hypothetical protein